MFDEVGKWKLDGSKQVLLKQAGQMTASAATMMDSPPRHATRIIKLSPCCNRVLSIVCEEYTDTKPWLTRLFEEFIQ